MIRKSAFFTACMAALLLLACGGNPDVTKRKLLDSGDRYFEQEKFKEAAILYRRAIAQDRRFGEAYYRLALAELKLGRTMQSIQALQRAAELSPENTDAFVKLTEFYLAIYYADETAGQRPLDELKHLIERAEKNQTDAVAVVRAKGQLALALDDTEEAVARFREALTMDPAHPATTIALIEALASAGRMDEAEKEGLALVERDKTYGAAYDRLYRMYALAKRFDAAERIARLKAENNPADIGAQLQLADHYNLLGDTGRRDAVLERLTASPDAYESGPVRVGDYYSRLGEFDAAVAQYRQGAEKDAAHAAEYKLRAAEALAAAGRFADSAAVAEEVLREWPNNSKAKVLRSSLLVQGGIPEQAQTAINEFESLVAVIPQNPVLRYNFGRAYMAAGDTDKAMVQFQEAANLHNRYQAPRFALGAIYMERSQPAMAARLADEVLAINPGSIDGRLLRARAAISLGELNQARGYVESVLRDEPFNATAQLLLASLNVGDKKFDEAVKILRSVRQTAPNDPRGVRALVGAYSAQGKHEEAQRVIDSEIAKRPGSAELRAMSAGVARAAKQYDRAIADYNRLLEINPNSAQIHIALGNVLYDAKRYGDAELHFRQARMLQPKSVDPALRLALLLGELGRQEETVALLDEVLKLAPENPVALNNMAYLLSAQPASLDTALTLAERAIGRAPGNATILDTLGWIYLKKNHSDKAVEVYQELVTTYPNNAKWRYHLGMALYQKGDRVRARRELEQALDRKPNDELKEKITNLLSQVGA